MIKENKKRESSWAGKQKLGYVTNPVSVKRGDLNPFADKLQSIDEWSMLVLSSTQKLGSP